MTAMRRGRTCALHAMKVSGVSGAKLAGFLSSATSYGFGATGVIIASFSFGAAARAARARGLFVKSLGLRIVLQRLWAGLRRPEPALQRPARGHASRSALLRHT